MTKYEFHVITHKYNNETLEITIYSNKTLENNWLLKH